MATWLNNNHRRIELEDKAKVVESVGGGGGGTKFVQFLAVLVVLPQSIWKTRMHLTLSFKWTKAKQLAQQ